MHATVARVTIKGDIETSLSYLREQVVPGVSQAPGFVAGYWTRKGSTGLSIVVFESEDAAQAMSEGLASLIPPDAATVDGVEVREVVAHA